MTIADMTNATVLFAPTTAADDTPINPSADLIEAHRAWMESTGRYSPTTVRDSCTLLYRVDRALARMQLAAGVPAGGLATAIEDELVAWLRRPTHERKTRKPLKQKWSRQTKATYRQPLVRFYEWAAEGDDPLLTLNPSVRLLRPTVNPPVPQPASDEQIAHIDRHAKDPHWLHCMLAAYAGFRPSDVAGAYREHFTPTTVRVRGKGDKPAILPLDPMLWNAVKDLPDGPIARRASPGSGPVTAASIGHDARYYLHHNLKLPICLRSLRAWYATTMLERYGDPRVVQELMRHTDLNTIMRYVAIVEARKRAAIFTLPHFGGRAGGGDVAADERGQRAIP